MSEWKKVKLGEICERVTSGGTPKANVSSYYNPPTIPWLKTKEVNYCRITETENYISEEGLKNSSAKLISPNSVIIAMYGQGDTAGRVAINKIPLATNQACCNLTIDKSKADYEFIYYQLCTLYDKLVSLKAGAAQPNLNARIIKNLEIIMPSLPIQHRIATILSRYDSLIENYQKQIKLLEEAAQRLYKEWFVDFHFPGHENTKIVDGVPEGWEKKKVGEIAIISAGGDKPDVVTEEQTTECQVPIYSNGTTKEGLYGYTNKSSNTAGSITVSARGSIGFACLRMHDYFSIVRLISIKPQNNVDLMYLFQFTKVHTFMSNGAAQQQLTVPMVKAIDVVYPAESLLEAFENVVLPLYQKVQSLQSQLRLLTEARDRLLPKLMSGEITV